MSGWRLRISPCGLLGVLLGVSLATFAGGCGDEPPSGLRVYYDLVARHRLAHRLTERRRFDLTVPGLHRYLGEGWSPRLPKSVDWKAPIRPGDTVTAKSHIHDIYEKTGRSGTMRFIVNRMNFTNQQDELVAVVDWKMIQKLG